MYLGSFPHCFFGTVLRISKIDFLSSLVLERSLLAMRRVFFSGPRHILPLNTCLWLCLVLRDWRCLCRSVFRSIAVPVLPIQGRMKGHHGMPVRAWVVPSSAQVLI